MTAERSPSVYWRRKRWLYRLEKGHREKNYQDLYRSESHMNQSEKRQIGFMSFITRQDSGGETQIFVMPDQSKSEIASGLPPVFGEAKREKGNTIAGGRDGEETLHENITREMREEIGELLEMLLASVSTSVSSETIAEWLAEIEVPNFDTKQPQPFIVGQLTPDKKIINEISVIAGEIAFDKLPWEVKTTLRHAVAKGKGRWVNLAWLYEAFQKTRRIKDADQMSNSEFRPQFLTAAAIHYLLKTNPDNENKVRRRVIAWNKRTIGHLKKYATENGYEINNGTVAESGNLLTLDAGSTQYLKKAA